MKVLIAGRRGQLAHELQRTAPAGWQLSARGAAELDLADGHAVQEAVRAYRPALVINTAAYTAVDRAEAERDLAYAVNARGAEHLAAACREAGCRLLHISTDYVFSGHASSPYLPAAATDPATIYGASKLAGEQAVLALIPDQVVVIRTAWLYSAHGRNFVKTMLRLMQERDELGVVADQVGTPSWGRELAQTIWKFADRPEVRGIYHATDAGVASWYDFAVAIYEEGRAAGLLDRKVTIRPLPTAAYPTPAPRPAYSVLDKTSTWDLFGPAPHWRLNLRAMLAELKETTTA